MIWTLKALDYALVVAAFLAAGAIWFIPNWSQGEDMKALEKAVNERKAQRLAYEAEQARIAEERERLGLVYLSPGPAQTAAGSP
jgi:hypothetical protein